MLKMQVKIFQKNKKRRKYYDKRFRTVELNFVSEGKLKYPGVNSKLFGNNIQVETEDEARNRLLQRIYEKYDAKHLTEVSKCEMGPVGKRQVQDRKMPCSG